MAENFGEITFLKKQIKLAIESGVDTIKEIAMYEKSNFKGYPACTLVCSASENSFYSSAENERIFIFTLRIYQPIEEAPAVEDLTDDAKKVTEEIMEKVVDQLLNTLDKTENFTLGDAADNGVEAIPSTWGYTLIGGGWHRTAVIEIRVRRILLVN